MKNNKTASISYLISQSKDKHFRTQLKDFLKAVPYLNPIGSDAILKLSKRFKMRKQQLAYHIYIASTKGGYNAN